MLMLLGGMLGAILGSFIGALCLRWPQGRSVMTGRSQCDGCGQILTPAELIPIVSFLLQRGRCRRCGAAINPLQMMAELAAAATGIGAFGLLPAAQATAFAIMGWILLPLILLDYRHYWLPDRLILLLAAAGLSSGLLLRPGYDPIIKLAAAAAGFAAFEAIRRGYRLLRGKDGMGAGDPKMVAALALWLPPLSLPYLLLGASTLGLLIFAATNKAPDARDHRIALGSCLAIAAMVIFFIHLRGLWV